MFSSVKRGLPRICVMAALAALHLLAAQYLASILGPVFTPLVFGFGLTIAALSAGDFCLRLLQPRVDTQASASIALAAPIGAGLVFLGRCILIATVLILMATASRAAEPPAAALPYLPMLADAQRTHWPAMPQPSTLGAQVEQETCPSLKHRMCWNPRAELKTSREQGIGLGQLTRTWRQDGTQRFDVIAELRRAYPAQLAGLSWDDPYDPRLQLVALVLKDRQGYEKIQDAASPLDRLAFTFAAYNGGIGGVNSDRSACRGTPGCDPGRWFGHVEVTSLKAKQAVPGYGKSFFDINREYVRNIMVVRRPRYQMLDAAT